MNEGLEVTDMGICRHKRRHFLSIPAEAILELALSPRRQTCVPKNV
jgi:hypothetical protein